jgi:YD repeat-containing protein
MTLVRVAALALAIACSRSRDREPPPLIANELVGKAPHDAAVPVDAGPPAWIEEAIARGGPGLCAAIRDGGVVVWRRDASGHVVESLELDAKHHRDPVGRKDYRYDRTGRLVRITERGADNHSFDTTTDLFYDARGRIVRVRDHHEPGALVHGDTNITYEWHGEPVTAPAVDRTRDGSENPRDPIGHVIAFHGTVREARFYDGSPAPQPETEYVHTFDARGRLVSTTSVGWAGPPKDAHYEWDPDDQLVEIRDPTSTWPVTRYTWRDHVAIEIRNLDRDGKEVRREAHRHDARGRLVETLIFVPPATDGRLASTHVDPATNTLVETYVMDEATGPRFRIGYRYDCGP